MNVIGRSKQIRYLSGQIVAPLGYVRHKVPLQVSNDVNKYTIEGRKAIHQKINHIDTYILKQLMENPNPKASIEYNDNLLSLYSAQKGKCRICGQELELEEIYCHHIIPKEFGGTIPWCRIEDIEGKYLNGTKSDQYVSEETIKKGISRLADFCSKLS